LALIGRAANLDLEHEGADRDRLAHRQRQQAGEPLLPLDRNPQVEMTKASETLAAPEVERLDAANVAQHSDQPLQG
jgi:hypothetical protein